MYHLDTRTLLDTYCDSTQILAPEKCAGRVFSFRYWSDIKNNDRCKSSRIHVFVYLTWMYTAHFFNKMSEINYWNWILYFRICYRLHPKRSVLWEVDINFDCMACAMFNSMKNACTYGYLDVGCLWPLSHLLCLSYSLGMGPNPSVNSTYSLTLRHRLSGRTDGITPSPRNLTRVRKLIKLSFIERF